MKNIMAQNKKLNESGLMDKIVSLCKRRGFIFPGSEIYGGMANSWDYGPLGVELKNNIKQGWWKKFVHSRTDMVGIDAALIMNPKVWEASGHLKNFTDPLFECPECHGRFRLDKLVPSVGKAKVESTPATDDLKKEYYVNQKDLIDQGIIKETIKCPDCHKVFPDKMKFRFFNLLFKTFIGSTEDAANVAYLRPETAQAMFVDFKQVAETSRKRVPFGIAQVGKAFRNEITPGNFIFRTREFEQMEIEYFIREKDWEKTFEYWYEEMYKWMKMLGLEKKHLHDLEVPEKERAHYSKRTIDIEYDFPFGTDELYGLAYRTDFDLSNHAKSSGQSLEYLDPETQEKFIPHVIEPTFGVDRSVLAVLCESYSEEEAPTSEEGKTEPRVVLKFPKWLAPIKVAILPLSKKEELAKVARPIYEDLVKNFACEYDETQSIGKRYRRQDEIGTPYCVTVDFETLEDKAVTVRDRDTMKQERIKISDLINYLKNKLEE